MKEMAKCPARKEAERTMKVIIKSVLREIRICISLQPQGTIGHSVRCPFGNYVESTRQGLVAPSRLTGLILHNF